MNNNIQTADLLRTLPPSLKHDGRMMNLATVISGELQRAINLVNQNVIYARIGELSEEVLDALAYDLHVDWYDYNHPVEAKRAVIRDSVKVHMRLGTKYAVVTALGSLYPETEVEEWFQYGGQPYYFRIVLDVTNSHVTATYSEIIRAVNMYKSLRSKLEEDENGIVFRSRSGILIKSSAGYYKFTSGMTGQRLAGTFPKTSTIGVIRRAGVTVEASARESPFISPLAGTRPVQSTVGVIQRESAIVSGETGEAAYSAPLTGTKPVQSTVGEVERSGTEMTLTGGNAAFNAKMCGSQPGQL